MPRRRLLVASLAFLAVAIGVGVAVFIVQREHADRERRRQETHERHVADEQAAAIALVARLEEESRSLIPPALDGVALGITDDELRARRPSASASRTAGDRDKVYYEENLPNGAQILYGVDRHARRLMQIQILSLLPSTEAISPHLTSMNDTYGSPTGVWDCPDTEGVPTRRFTWRRSLSTVMDVFLVFRGRVSLTLYIAPNEFIGASLARSHCHPTPPAEFGAFPVATDQQMNPPDAGRGGAPFHP